MSTQQQRQAPNNSYAKSNTYGMQNQLRTLERRLNSPKTDLLETPSAYVVRMELPVQNYTWEIKDSRFLLVTGTKVKEDFGENVREVYRETRYGPITRRVKLPATIRNTKPLSEKWENGVLLLEFERDAEVPNAPTNSPVGAWADEVN